MEQKRQRIVLRQKRSRASAVDRSRSGRLDLETDRQFRVPSTVSFPKAIIGFPDRLETTLRYCESYSFSASPGPAAQVLMVNSCFDPNVTGTGHQPSFFDTFSAIYGRYFVESFCLEVFVSNHTAVPIEAAVAYSDVNQSGNNVEQISEAKYAKYALLAQTAAGGSTKKIFMPWMTTQQLMGQPYTEADDNMYALISANPADNAFGYVKLKTDDGTTNVSAIVRVILHQRVIFKDLLTQVSS